MRVAVLFPGQGSQAPGMGACWRDHEAWNVVERAEAALGEPVAPLLLDEEPGRLARTREAQLAVLVTSLVAWEAVRPGLADAPVAFAGHSLGQVTALLASGALDFEAGIRLAAARAHVTQTAADHSPGRMAALLGATPEQAQAACDAAPGACWVANDNAPGQVVIAGTPAGVDAAVTAARDAGVRKSMALDVDGAFHTPLMADAAAALAPVVGATSFHAGDAPVVSNTDATPYGDGDGWRARLVDHLVRPVRWRESQQTLVSLDVDAFVEVGPGQALAAMARRTVPGVDVRSVSTPELTAVLTEVG